MAVRYVLGLDVGSNSVGSAAWVYGTNEVATGVSVFPAGVESSDRGRGAPVGRDRRNKRLLRRMIARRAARKRAVWCKCIDSGLLPASRAEFDALVQDESQNPWRLRAEGLNRELTPYEFGRILLHLAQRRGGLGLNLPGDDENRNTEIDDEVSATRAAFDHTAKEMHRSGARTYGELIWTAFQASRRLTPHGVEFREPVRNRHNLIVDHPERAFFAKREMIRSEFLALWNAQRKFGGALAALLTEDLKTAFDDPREDENWRHQGIIFEQRRTKWDLGVLGRCTLEPTDRCVPLADMHAQRFRVIEVSNNLRVRSHETERHLTPEERARVIELLSSTIMHEAGKHRGKPKRSVSATDLKRVLGLPLRDKAVRLNFEDKDADRDIHTDWFAKAIALPGFGTARWAAMSTPERESVNRAVLKHDPENEEHERRLRAGCSRWWGLSQSETDAFISGWRSRPALASRLSMSRRAILNLLPYLDRPRPGGGWPTQIEARFAFAEDAAAKDVATGAPPSPEQRRRYFRGVKGLTHQDRRFLAKHPDLLPPAPMMTNPVVRKAIHEVRRHIVAYIRRFGAKPERVVIEFARDATQSAKVRDEILNRNRWRDKHRQQIGEEIVAAAWGGDLHKLSTNQRRAAVDRVILARQQRWRCPYCGAAALTERKAALGAGAGGDCETDHIQPYSTTGDNSLNNKVLCCITCNRAKSQRSPRQWWAGEFDVKADHARVMFENHTWEKGEYFSPRDFASKWRNFTRETPASDSGGFGPGQLEATAHAARAVKSYLSDALYDGRGSSEHAGERSILVTHGKYTAMLRRDWQLFQTLHDDAQSAKQAGTGSPGEKHRGDHRHHAIDAVVIALTTPDLLARIGRTAKQAEEYFSRTGQYMRRTAVEPPFGADVADFRRAVLRQVFESFDRAAATGARVDGTEPGSALCVAHRPVKRKLIGHLHKDTMYGPVLRWNAESREWERDPTKTTGRIPVGSLKPPHVRVPDGWDIRSATIRDPTSSRATRAQCRRELAAMQDVPPLKGGVIRDRMLRDRVRRALRELGLDPDEFTDKELKAKLDAGATITLDSGKPVRSVVLLRTNSDPIAIPRKRWNAVTRSMEVDRDPRTVRLYDGQNNHHVEIREDTKGRWSGDVVTGFTAAGRVRIEKRPVVDRSDDESRGGKFIMSLAEGEMVYMKHPTTGKADHFVVFKVDRAVHFAHHWDARGASERKSPDGKPIPGSAREDISVPVSKLKALAPEGREKPDKVAVSPLGSTTVLERD